MLRGSRCWWILLVIVSVPLLIVMATATAPATPTARLNNGQDIPLLGLGTWKSSTGDVQQAVETAIELGYRHIDCAHVYGNEKEAGHAIRNCIEKGICTREELFITSKLWNDSHKFEDVMPALKHTLEQLGLDYLDMYLIHWPVALKKGSNFPNLEFLSLEEVPISETWKGMENCVAAGLTRGIGVSNFNVKKLQDLLKQCTIPAAINQIERHPYLQQPAMMEFCKANNIHVTNYSPLGSMDRPKQFKPDNEPIVLEDPTIDKIAKQHNISRAQVILKWGMQTGASTIPKSVNPKRLAENLLAAATNLPQLTDENLLDIAKINRNRRYVDGTFWTSPEHSPYTLENLWDEGYEE